MAGVRQFDEEEMLDQVLTVFWRQGYEATAMADLAKATGIQRGSLYNAYGGKEPLLLKALNHYAVVVSRPAREALADPDPRRAIVRFLDAHVDRMSNPANPPGCLATNTCLECVGRYPAVEQKIEQQFKATEDVIYQVLKRAQKTGGLVLKKRQNLRALARFFLSTSRGMAVMHKAYGGNLRVVKDVARTALEVLDPPTATPA